MKSLHFLVAGMLTFMQGDFTRKEPLVQSIDFRISAAIEHLASLGLQDNFEVREEKDRSKLDGIPIFLLETPFIYRGRHMEGLYLAREQELFLEEGAIYLPQNAQPATIYAELLHHHFLPQKNMLLETFMSTVTKGGYTLSSRVDDSVAVIVDEAVSHALAHSLTREVAEYHDPRYVGVAVLIEYINKAGVERFITEYQEEPIKFWKLIKEKSHEDIPRD
jgi:hypothetical protein